MRIVIVTSGLRYGGAETQIIELARELAQRGHALAIYTLTDSVPRRKELEGSAVELVTDNKRGKLDLQVLRRLRRFIRKFRADIVHGFLYDGNIYSRVAGMASGIPVLNSERSDDYVLRRSQVWPHRLTRRLARGVVANSWKGRDFAQQLFGLPDAHMHVVSNGVRLEAIEQRLARNTENYKRLFFGEAQARDIRVACLVGSIVHAKDYLLALEVADRLTKLDACWRVLFVGDSIQAVNTYAMADAEESMHYRHEVLARFKALGMAGRVHFAGRRADALEIIAQCDVLFSTSRREGFPNVVLEAMSVGTPVAAVDFSDIRRILPMPWQIAARDPEALARTILRAYIEREAVVRAQRAWVRENAGIERAVDQLLAVYAQYVSKAG